MKLEFPNSEAAIDPIWTEFWTTAHRLKVWYSTNWADQILLEISFLSGGNKGSSWNKNQTKI